VFRIIDRIFGVLLILGACGHTIGTLMLLQPGSGIFIWSLGSSLAASLLGVLNIEPAVPMTRLWPPSLPSEARAGLCWLLRLA
jgi:hypothetical protein